MNIDEVALLRDIVKWKDEIIMSLLQKIEFDQKKINTSKQRCERTEDEYTETVQVVVKLSKEKAELEDLVEDLQAEIETLNQKLLKAEK